MATQQVEFDLARINDLELIVNVGDQLSEHGLTRVIVDGTGRLAVEQQRGRETVEQFSGELNQESAERLFRQILQFDWSQRFPPRPGLPDEAIVEWTLRDSQGSTRTLKVWLRDAEKHGAMAPAFAELRRHVDRLSYGKLYL
jgi:hypothetical protein